MNNLLSLIPVILWVSWCKNKCFWKRFTCNDFILGWCFFVCIGVKWIIFNEFCGQNKRKIKKSIPHSGPPRVVIQANSVLAHCTVNSQDFRSFCFLSVFLSKIVQLKFFCEITTYTSRLLSFDKFFPIWSWLLIFFVTFNPVF